MAGRFEEAESILDVADARYPDDRDLLGTRAFLAMEREDWNTALDIWRVYRERFPTDPAGWEGQGKTIAAVQAARVETPGGLADVVKLNLDTVDDDATRNLLLGFESIGSDCEFGLVQRRFGVEALGLLRFSNVKLPNLMAALAAGFDGMGELPHTSLATTSNGEIYIADRRWGLGMHTFMFADRQDMAALLPKICRRSVYLRDKMLADLRDAQKVFVFKSDAIDLEGLRALHDALRAHGPVRLLHVRRARVPITDRPFAVRPGQVFRLDTALFIGFLGRMGDEGTDWDIAFDEWISICEGVGDAPPLP